MIETTFPAENKTTRHTQIPFIDLALLPDTEISLFVGIHSVWLIVCIPFSMSNGRHNELFQGIGIPSLNRNMDEMPGISTRQSMVWRLRSVYSYSSHHFVGAVLSLETWKLKGYHFSFIWKNTAPSPHWLMHPQTLEYSQPLTTVKPWYNLTWF